MSSDPRSVGELRALGLTLAEYTTIVELLGREPNQVELGMFSAMWSEHCGYKHSRLLLRTLPSRGALVVQGPGENAGAVSLGDGLLLVMKIESHNHPSAIEPYQGAATGVGGILRDIFAMGARPIALMDSLRFGLPDPRPRSSHPSQGTTVPGARVTDDLVGEVARTSAPPGEKFGHSADGITFDARTRFLFHGVVAGVGGYGNCMGVPTVGGETVFEPCYTGNPLVNVLCLGLAEEGKLLRAHGGVPGNLVVLFGAATGRDGIHGASFASVELDERSEERRPAVQVGDPLTEKLLMEACLELRERGLLAGLQDLGAAGLTSSTVEMADKTGSGIFIDLDRVPRRAPEMTPYELLLSESQERMLAAVEPDRLAAVEAVLDRWELPHAVIGRITDDGVVHMRAEGRTVVEVPVRLFTDACPAYELAGAEDEEVRQARETAPNLPAETDWGQALLEVLGHPNIGSKGAIWQRYDSMVGTNTVVGPGADAAVLRLKGRRDGVAISVDGNSRLCYLDPYLGGALAVAESARNLSCVGARPLCATDCLNFGNPEKPGVAYQLRQAVAGMAAACEALGVPIVSGNVSLYNENLGAAIYPTPIVGMAGRIDEVARHLTPGFVADGDRIYLLGGEAVSLGGSIHAWIRTGNLTGTPAPLDLGLERRVQECLRAAIAGGLLRSAHDCSDGGLAVAVAECALAGNVGATIETPDPEDSSAETLFGEGSARVVVSLAADHLADLEALAREHEVLLRRLGVVGGETLQWHSLFTVNLSSLRASWAGALADLTHV
ncbi:MAG TPA: phosphoribosylformylglycinamidine synthase subunit PurL [Chloroflexota bacterium]|nr:phosphoribosylformylglycinamidine synthase subunit PurL [Chloroflexota bacterium]